MAKYRDYDGVTRRVEASGKSATQASRNLRMRLQTRTLAGRDGELTGMTRFREAADVWLVRMDAMVVDGRRSPAPVET
jgi:hypothetical protein